MRYGSYDPKNPPATTEIFSIKSTLFKTEPVPIYLMGDGRFAYYDAGWQTKPSLKACEVAIAKTQAAVRGVIEVFNPETTINEHRDGFDIVRIVRCDRGQLITEDGIKKRYWGGKALWDPKAAEKLKALDLAFEKVRDKYDADRRKIVDGLTTLSRDNIDALLIAAASAASPPPAAAARRSGKGGT